MKILSLALLLACTLPLAGQPNCNAYLHQGDTLKYRACQAAKKRNGHYQFSRRYQEALDRALEIDSSYAPAYRAKSTAYLKSGDFITWKKLMDLAVAHDLTGQLDYRGWCRYQFFRDYKGAIEDLEHLEQLLGYDMGYSVNGDYHLQVAKALCYKALGNKKKAIAIMEQHLVANADFLGPYDYLHMGVLYLETQQYASARKALQQQEATNDLAENRYYTALVHKALGDQIAAKNQLIQAQQRFQEGYRMFDPYVEMMDQIFLDDITSKISELK